MVPTAVLPPVIPFTVQVTPFVVVLVTVAVNCRVAEVETVALVGDTVVVMAGGAFTLIFTGAVVAPPSPVLVTVMAT